MIYLLVGVVFVNYMAYCIVKSGADYDKQFENSEENYYG